MFEKKENLSRSGQKKKKIIRVCPAVPPSNPDENHVTITLLVVQHIRHNEIFVGYNSAGSALERHFSGRRTSTTQHLSALLFAKCMGYL